MTDRRAAQIDGELDLIPDDEPMQWWRRMSAARGEILRHLLERGCSGEELGQYVVVLRREKEGARRILLRWPVRVRFRVRRPVSRRG